MSGSAGMQTMSTRVMLLAVLFLATAVSRADPPESYTPASREIGRWLLRDITVPSPAADEWDRVIRLDLLEGKGG
jgi:hypothetical protein